MTETYKCFFKPLAWNARMKKKKKDPQPAVSNLSRLSANMREKSHFSHPTINFVSKINKNLIA